MDVFLDAMIGLTATHRDDDVLSSKQVRSLVDTALDRMCEDDEFAELCNVLELDASAKKFPVNALKASIQAARAGCEEWEEEGEDAGGGEEDGGFLEAVGAARGTRDMSETRSAAASEEGYDIGGDESEAESIGGGDHVTSSSRQGSSDNFLALEFESPGGAGPRTQTATGDSPAAVLASALGLEGVNGSHGDSQGDASGRSSPRYDLEELELDDVFDDSRSHRSGNLSQPNLTNTAPAANQPVNRRASVDSALEQEKRKSLSDSNNDGSGYDVGDDESQDSAEAAVTAARVAANTSHNSGRQKSNNSSASSSRDGAVSAAALLAQRDAEVATLKAETDALRRAYAALEADALAKAEEQEAVIEELAKEYEAALDAAGVPYGGAPDDALGAEDEGNVQGMEVILEEDEESLEQERYSGDDLAAQALRAKRLSRDNTDKKKKQPQAQPQAQPPRGRQKSADEVIRKAKGTPRALSPTGGAAASSNTAGSDASHTIQQLQEEVSKLKQQLESMTSREQEAEKDLSALMQEFATTTTAKEEAETKAQELTDALAAAQQESDKLRSAADVDDKGTKVGDMQKEVAQLQAALASAQEEVTAQATITEDAQKALEAQKDRIETLEAAMKDTEAYTTSAVAAAVATVKEEAEAAAAAAATKAKEEAASKVAYFGKTLHTTRQEAAEKQAELEKALEAALAAAKEGQGNSEETSATVAAAAAAADDKPDVAEQLSAAESKVAALEAQLEDMTTAAEAATKAATKAAANSEARISAAEDTAATATAQEKAQSRVAELQEALEAHKFTHFANMTRAKQLNTKDETMDEDDLKAQWSELTQDEKDKYASAEGVQLEQSEALSAAVAAAVAAHSTEAAKELAKVQEELNSALSTQAQLHKEVAAAQKEAQALQEQQASERGRGGGGGGGQQTRTRSSDLSLSCVNDDNEESLAQSRIVAMSPDNADENEEAQQGDASSSQRTPVKGKNSTSMEANNSNDEEVLRLRATVAAMETERADKAQELLDMIGEVAQLEAECNALREASTTNASLSRTQIGDSTADASSAGMLNSELEKLNQECADAVAALAASRTECTTLQGEVTALTQGLAAAREEAAAAAAMAKTKDVAASNEDTTSGSSPKNDDNEEDDTVRGAGVELAARLVEQQKRVAGGHENSDQAAKQAAKVAASLRAQVAALQAALDRAMDEKLALHEDAKSAHTRADAAEATATALTRARSAAEEEVSAGADTVAELQKKLTEAKEALEGAKEEASAMKQQFEDQSAVAAEDMEALAAELVAAEEARDVAHQALAAAQSSSAASTTAGEDPPSTNKGSTGNVAHLRGQSPDAAFDLLKRTQTIDSLRRANAAAATKSHELTQKCAAAEARAMAAEAEATTAKEALSKYQSSGGNKAAALKEAEAAATLAAKEATDAAIRHESSLASAEVANLKAKLTEALSSAAEAATRAAIAEEEVANQAALTKRSQEEEHKRQAKREAEIRAEVTAELATAAKLNAANEEEAAMSASNKDSSKAAKRAAQAAAAAAQSADVARATAAERAAAEEAEEAVALALQLSGEIAHLKAELDATRASRDAHAQAAERAGAALNDKHLLQRPTNHDTDDAPAATKAQKATALEEVSSNKENRDTSTTSQMAHPPPPKNNNNNGGSSGSGAAARAAARAREAVRKEAAARVLALETTVAKQAAHIVSLRGQRDWLWPLLNFPVVFWMSQVSSEFSTFLAVFLGTVTLLAVAAKMGIFDRNGSDSGDSNSNKDPSSTSFTSGDAPMSDGASTDAGSRDNSSGGVSSPQSSDAGGWARVLRNASKQHDATSTAALSLMVLFFGWVLAVNPLDEAQYYVLGFCNPLLYGLPFAIHYALSPHAGTTKARPAPSSASPPQATN